MTVMSTKGIVSQSGLICLKTLVCVSSMAYMVRCRIMRTTPTINAVTYVQQAVALEAYATGLLISLNFSFNPIL